MQLSAVWPELCRYLQFPLTSAAIKSPAIAKALINDYERGTNVKRMKDQHVAGYRELMIINKPTLKKIFAPCGVLEIT